MRYFDISTIIELTQGNYWIGSNKSCFLLLKTLRQQAVKPRQLPRALSYCRVLLVWGLTWGIGKVQAQAGFEDTISQCDAAFGPAVVHTTDKALVCAETRAYVKDGMSVLIGFNVQGHAEEFVYSKMTGAGKIADLSEGERQAILEQYKAKSSWTLNHTAANGPVWYRADGQAFASYVKPGCRLVLLSKEGMQGHMKSLHKQATR